MKSGYSMQLEQSQKLKMTPELVQAIGLLQLNTQELSTFIQEQILANPVLETAPAEEKTEFSADSSYDAAGSDSWSDKHTDWSSQVERLIDSGKGDLSYRGYISQEESGSGNYENYAQISITLKEYMLQQLYMTNIGPRDMAIATYLIESLDERGYVSAHLKGVAGIFKTTEDHIEEVLGIIQGFEPAGVAARDLAECLRIQLISLGEYNRNYEKMISAHIEDIAANRLPAIAKQMDIPLKEVQRMSDCLKSLEPKPGRQFAGRDDTKYVIPDLTLEKNGDKFNVVLNEASVPKLRISTYYENLLQKSKNDKELADYLKAKMDSAMWLLRSIEQRNTTVIAVATAIIDYQQDFFTKGEEYLKPLTLRMVADKVGVHESTVSRAVSGKYMQTAVGMFEMKSFFKSGISTSDGESAVSSDYVKRRIREMIENEEAASPLSDETLSSMLDEEGISISRRTVAKYRDAMGIQSSAKRKRY